MAIWGNDATTIDEDYSSLSTLIHFDSPIPLLRMPVPDMDESGAGGYVLAFRDSESWRSAFELTKSKFADQCIAGSRIGCSVSASKKCKPPWWKTLFGIAASDYAEREKCEERELEACLASAKEMCIRYAKEKCEPAFRDARIVSKKGTIFRGSALLLD